MKGFIFKYNKYGKPSSKSYMAPRIEEFEILRYEKMRDEDTGKTVFEVTIKEGTEFTDIIKEQLILFFMNKYGVKNYSSVVINLIYETNC